MKSRKVFEYIALFFAIFVIGLILSRPDICTSGAISGAVLCADVILPALFPFTVPVLFIINTSIFKKSGRKLMFAYILSLLGGYPVGAKLLSEIYRNKLIDKKTAEKALPLFVNAGPAFIVAAVGQGILKSATAGYILLISHIFASIICVIIYMPQVFTSKSENNTAAKEISVCDNLVLSIHNATGAVISVCGFVIAFSVANSFILSFSGSLGFLKPLMYATEVTTAVKNTRSIYLIAFLLGFSGLSVIAQVYSVSGEIKPNLLRFIMVRILHGAISSGIAKIIFRFSNAALPAISNGADFGKGGFSSGAALGITLAISALLLIIHLSSKKYSGNILKDMV